MSRVRREPPGDQRRRAGDESVERDRHGPRGRRQDDANEPGDLEAADLREHVDRIAGIRPIHVEGAADRVDLSRERRIIDAGSPSRHLLHGRTGQGGCDRARRGRVADPHLAGADQIGAAVERVERELCALFDRGDRVRARHRRAARHVVRSGGDARLNETCARRAGCHDTEVGHDESRSGLARQHVDRSAAPQEVLDHLGRDRLRIRADSFGDDAVVPREREDHGRIDRRGAAAEHREPHRKVLQPAETSRRLRQRVNVSPRLGRNVAGRRANRAKEPGEIRHGHRPGFSRRRQCPPP